MNSVQGISPGDEDNWARKRLLTDVRRAFVCYQAVTLFTQNRLYDREYEAT